MHLFIYFFFTRDLKSARLSCVSNQLINTVLRTTWSAFIYLVVNLADVTSTKIYGTGGVSKSTLFAFGHLPLTDQKNIPKIGSWKKGVLKQHDRILFLHFDISWPVIVFLNFDIFWPVILEHVLLQIYPLYFNSSLIRFFFFFLDDHHQHIKTFQKCIFLQLCLTNVYFFRERIDQQNIFFFLF